MKQISNFWIDDHSTDRSLRADCCGCSACDQICGHGAISMHRDDEGFFYPKVDETKCVGCTLCVKVCPIINSCQSKAPYLKTYAGYSLDEVIMRNSTSGGFVTTLSQLVIDRGGIVYGVRFDDSLTKTHYQIACTHDELRILAGSKYVQSDKEDTFTRVRADLREGKNVLFVGCPCDVAGLKRFLMKDYDNLLTCELVCMGVTSPKVASDYKAWSEKKNRSRLVEMNMRSKMKGWFVPHLEEHFANGKIKCNTLFGTYIGYGFQIFNRTSCFFCQYRDTTGVGDIRVGDFWGIKDSDEFWNPNGVSGIYVRTKKGLRAVHELLTGYQFKLFETDYILATRSNMSSFRNKPKRYLDLRDKFAEVYIKEGRGLIAACKVTSSPGFWIKHYVPDVFHAFLKKMYHLITDKKR